MKPWLIRLLPLWIALFAASAVAQLTPEQVAQLPSPAAHRVDFTKEIQPILEVSCTKCHGRGKEKAGFRIDTRETLLEGGDSGPAVVIGNSRESLLIELVMGFDPDNVMPAKGSRLTAQQISLLRAWIDQGLDWDPQVTFAKVEARNLHPRLPEIPPAKKVSHPIDAFLDAYFNAHQIQWPAPVDDRVFARRVYLDILGLLPPPDQLNVFLADRHRDKRERLVQRLLEDNHNYAEHWLTFWNDLLRNDYKGTGYIDGGRKQITKWLYAALLNNMPYDRFVAELVNPTPESEGFTKGIVWRGVVNASQIPEMQAAQSVSQVFMGINLKCASCHDSFINDWQLSDAYSLANVYAAEPLELFECDKPLGRKAATAFLYPEFGAIDPGADRPTRLKQLAEGVTSPENGRLSRTLVNRLWGRFFGRALVEPVDDMEQAAWNSDLLDWLAEDFVANHHDVKHTIARILTSRAYQLPAVNLGEIEETRFVFRGPGVRRLSAEQFRDALTAVTGIGYPDADADVDSPAKGAAQKKFNPPVAPLWIWNHPEAAAKARPETVYFRKTVHLEEAASEAVAVVSCDNSFTLFINGAQVASSSDWTHPSVLDVRGFLRKGDNLIAIEAVNFLPGNVRPSGESDPGNDNPAGLVFYARVRSQEDGVEKVMDFVSDNSWRWSVEKTPGWERREFADGTWSAAFALGKLSMLPWRLRQDFIAGQLAAAYPGKVRASLVAADPLMVALGRPNREQIVTTRPTAATTLEALELTNGGTMTGILRRGAASLVAQSPSARGLVNHLYAQALGRKAGAAELKMAEELVGNPARAEGVEDLLWAITMLPEFQLIY